MNKINMNILNSDKCMKVLLQTLAYVEIFKSKSEDFIMY